jgi:uncharacterized protein with NRDE domain
MCTATYLPISNKHFILTHNRDEHIGRKIAELPASKILNGVTLTYPKDAEAHGTWILSSDSGYTLCILNGAIQKHVPNPPYAKSRGLIPLDFFLFEDVFDFADNYEFKGIEPFTLLIMHTHDVVHLYELLWDGKEVYLNELDASQPKIWSSVTLYSEADIIQREKWFNIWVKENAFTSDNIRTFHRFSPADKEGIIINRADQKITVSITCVQKLSNNSEMHYSDLLGLRDSVITL